MADFTRAIKFVLEKEGGYQALVADRGNYNSAGQLIGTNYGISAPILERYLGRLPTVNDMKTLSQNTAVEIYKRFFWDRMRGDQINNLAVALAIFDWYVNAGLPALTFAQSIAGVTADGIIGPNSIRAINSQDSLIFFNRYQAVRKSWYEGLVKRRPSNQVFLRGWLRRVDSIKYKQWAV
jgi:lysozyme family protein